MNDVIFDGLKDSYETTRGRTFYLKSYSERFALLRCDHFGHVENRIVRRNLDSGQLPDSLPPVKSFRPAYDNANLWLLNNSEHYPKVHYAKNIQDIVEAAQESTDRDPQEIMEWNKQRLAESRQNVINSNTDNDDSVEEN